MTAASMAADENAAAIAGDRLADPSTTRLFLMQPITGSDGSVLLTDGAVIIRRTGTLASRGAQLIIPLAAITDVQLHLGTLSKIYFAYIGGPSNLPSSPSAVMFQRRDSAQFEWLRDAVLERMRTRFLAPVEREATDLSFEPDPGISRLKSELVVINRALSESASDTMKSQGVYGLNRAILKFVTRDTSDHKAELAHVARQLEAHIELLEESDKRAAEEWTRARAHRRQRLQAIVDTLMEESHSRAGDDDLPSVIAPLQSLCHPLFVPTSATPPRLAALAGECVVAEYKTELIGFEDAGYALSAQLSGGFAGSSGSLSLHGEHLGLSAGAFSGQMSAAISGGLEKREKFHVLDEGRFTITSTRIDFLGTRRSDEVRLVDLLSARGSEWTLSLQWPTKRDGETYRLVDGDILASLILALKARSSRASAPPSLAPTVAGELTTPPAESRTRRIERECPWCAELILAKARVCKHCGRDVPPDSTV